MRREAVATALADFVKLSSKTLPVLPSQGKSREERVVVIVSAYEIRKKDRHAVEKDSDTD
jgi:hypothetical protein